MHRILKITLAIIVVSCPVRCQLGWSDCCGEMNSPSLVMCCCSDSDLETPAFPADDTEERCGCICCGATMPDGSVLIYQTSVEFELAQFPMANSLTTDYELGRGAGILANCKPSCAKNFGRQLRCLHGSLII
ncbi:MAG: hypothetical protein ACKVHR_09130 [Pirellulales bacterium]|jgi:hypothetical protein